MRARRDPVRGWIGLQNSRLAIGAFAFLLILSFRCEALASSESLDFFEKQIRPVLVLECYECHGPEKQKGGLRLDSRPALLKGGDSGPAILPGRPGGSLLIQSITHEHAELKMPHKRPKLSERVIRDFVQWVEQGAPDPRNDPAAPSNVAGENLWEKALATRKEWWSLQPVRDISPPDIKAARGPGHPVDRFIDQRLANAGLKPAPPADPRTLIRRVTFALTGLPPTPGEIQEFLSDTAPGAYERLVDRLLASPRFGERWARHWMDLVRFAETHGSEGDPEIPEAWRYRDYLIRGFNADVPCDQLIREHLAGDLLPNPRWNASEQFNESILGIAHFRLVEHGFQPVDTLQEQVKVVENQIDVLGKAFQGLTLSCARCHDHKFDAISQRDYYALYGILASCRPAMVTIDSPERLRVHRERLQTLKPAIQQHLIEAWLAASQSLMERLHETSSSLLNQKRAPDDLAWERIQDLEAQIAGLERAAYQHLFKNQSTAEEGRGRMPASLWTFDGHALDLLGSLHGELQGGARFRDGRLILNGKNAFARTQPIQRMIEEKTFEVWLVLPDKNQRGGGAITLETLDGGEFDSIVYGERERGKWMAGSDGFRRTQNVEAGREEAAAGELIHVAIVYDRENRIVIYRNGEPYGSPYQPRGERSELRAFRPEAARVLFGLRHTGAGNGFLAAEIEEARLYDRALSADQIRASFEAGTIVRNVDQLARALPPEQQEQLGKLRAAAQEETARFARQYPDYSNKRKARERLLEAIEEARKNPDHLLHPWAGLRNLSGDEFHRAWNELKQSMTGARAARQRFNAGQFKPAWDLAGSDASHWFPFGINPPEWFQRPGQFSIEPEGSRALTGLLPAGFHSHGLSQKHNGVLQSPRFRVTSDNISVRAVGGQGARVRLVSDDYPLGAGNIFPQAEMKNSAPAWVRLDTAYRKGSLAYLEFAPADEILSRDRKPSGNGRSYFGVERIIFHDQKELPKDEFAPAFLFLDADAPASAGDLAELYSDLAKEAVHAWREDGLNEMRRAFLDGLIHAGLLPVALEEDDSLKALVEEYRRWEAEIPAARRAPGLLETASYDAPLMERGDHLRPGEPVSRRYLEVLGSQPYQTASSGRLRLAEEITHAENPLTARVMVNRIWHHLFGRGLVPSVDNFGRLGEKPAHPELLDYLAGRFVREGWSFKRMIRLLVTTQTFRRASEPDPGVSAVDPGNVMLSHMPVRRLEAEAIRDALLAVSGRLQETPFGPGSNALAPPAEQTRRSVYLKIRRNSLSPFLETFDAPKPFTTLGRRDLTNVPAQSLALLNDPFVIELARAWAESLVMMVRDERPEQRLERMFERALGRPPSGNEMEWSLAYLEELETEHAKTESGLDPVAVWADFAQSLFNLKEFIFIR